MLFFFRFAKIQLFIDDITTTKFSYFSVTSMSFIFVSSYSHYFERRKSQITKEDNNMVATFLVYKKTKKKTKSDFVPLKKTT